MEGANEIITHQNKIGTHNTLARFLFQGIKWQVTVIFLLNSKKYTFTQVNMLPTEKYWGRRQGIVQRIQLYCIGFRNNINFQERSEN